MNPQILTNTQNQLLSLIKKLSPNFGLVGGTAIALYIGHRRSIDFDLFSTNEFNSKNINRIIEKTNKVEKVLFQNNDEYTLIINSVKFTFFYYPYKISFINEFKNIIKLPDLETLAAMKAFALGQRAKWKDYVDLYFIFQKIDVKTIIKQTKKIFGVVFNEKLFRAQLGYFRDIDYTEQIEYMEGFEKKDDEIKNFLERISLS